MKGNTINKTLNKSLKETDFNISFLLYNPDFFVRAQTVLDWFLISYCWPPIRMSLYADDTIFYATAFLLLLPQCFFVRWLFCLLSGDFVFCVFHFVVWININDSEAVCPAMKDDLYMLSKHEEDGRPEEASVGLLQGFLDLLPTACEAGASSSGPSFTQPRASAGASFDSSPQTSLFLQI